MKYVILSPEVLFRIIDILRYCSQLIPDIYTRGSIEKRLDECIEMIKESGEPEPFGYVVDYGEFWRFERRLFNKDTVELLESQGVKITPLYDLGGKDG